MDSRSLHTASSYINNLLLSRGLLRNGTPIDFADPAKTDGGVDATMSNVMNLVHDLILRRDREADTFSNLSHNLQTVRTLSLQQTQTIARLETRNADLDRQLALSSTQEKTARATLRTAETRTRALREEMTRLKGTVAQIRGQCANDIRRRDGETKRLKRHLEGRRGREGNGGQVGVVVITPCASRSQQHSRAEDCVDVASPDYSLKQETTDFLTQLSQGLSDENDALIGLVRNTLATLRSLQGLPSDPLNVSHESHSQDRVESTNVMIMAPPSYEELATDTDEVLEHLRGLLTNPSFVPLEEVEIREDEIIRLREGWEKMATRWKEAMAMMDGWRKRMVDTGDTINLDDLTRGMNLAAQMPAAAEGNEDLQGEEGEGVGDTSNHSSHCGVPVLESPKAPSPLDHQEMGELAVESPSTSNVLRDRSPNVRPAVLPRKVSFPSIAEESEWNEDNEEDASLFDLSCDKTRSSAAKRGSAIAVPEWFSPPKPTVQQKLDQAEAEAEHARTQEEQKDRRKKRVNNRLKGSRRRSTLSPEELENLMGAV